MSLYQSVWTLILKYQNDLTLITRKCLKNIKCIHIYTYIYIYITYMYTYSFSKKCPAKYYEKQRHLLRKIQDATNNVHRTMKPQSPSKEAPRDLTYFSWHLFHCSKHSTKFIVGIDINCPIIFSWISSVVWIFSLSKVILVLGKARSSRMPNLGWSRGEAPAWFDVSPRNSAWDAMFERVCCHDEAANHHLPIAVAVFIV